MKKVLTVMAITGAALLTLAGCSGDNSAPKLPNDLGFVSTPLDAVTLGTHTAGSEDLDQRIIISDEHTAIAVLGGSSSCPPVIENVVNGEGNVIQLNLKSYSEACTMDYTLAGWQITSLSTNFSFTGKTFQVCSNETCSPLRAVASA